jgi:hypothetical protein
MHKLKIYFLAVIVFTGASCKKYLDKSPIDTSPEELVFSSLTGVDNAITGTYAALATAHPNTLYATSLMTDEAMLPTENNTGRGVIAYRWQHTSGTAEYTNAWQNYYDAINRANKILEHIDEVPVTDAAETTLRNQYKGEALATRAFAHFELTKNYAVSFDASALAVPYMEESVISKPSRTTVGDVIAKAKADLAAAKDLIPASFAKNTRVTRTAIAAMQAQIALYEKNWDNAITFSTEVITASSLANQAQYAAMWKDQNNTELVWKLKRNVGEARIGDTYYDRTQNKIIYAPSKELRDLYDQVNDVRYSTTILALTATRFTLAKYRGGDAANLNLADLKIFRTSEMYLIRAEAYAEKNDLVQGAASLNALRAARITGYVNQTFASKDALVNAIITERFKELAFEGHRYFDLKRKKLPITRITEDAINALGATTLNPDQTIYIFPIQLGEIQANENMQQNTGY